MSTTALILVTKILLTGIIPFVPSAKDPHLIRVVVPNSRIPTPDESSLGITGHAAYVIFRFDDLQPGSRVPDVVFTDANGQRYGIVWLESEFLTVDGNFKRDPLQFNLNTSNVAGDAPDSTDGTSLHWLYDAGHAGTSPPIIDRALLTKTPDPAKVTVRMNLRYGVFAVEPSGVDSSTRFIVNAQNHCQALTRAVSVTLQPVKGDEPAALTITSTPFRGKDAAKPIKLKNDSDLMVLIGNEAINDVVASVEVFNPMPHDSTMTASYVDGPSAHVQLANRLLKSGNVAVLTRIPVSLCVNGMFSHGNFGKNGGCSPLLLPPGDPTP